MTDEVCRELIFAIIMQAAKDYICASKKLEEKFSYKASNRKEECLQFFRSAWFGFMTDLDPEWFIERLDECTQSEEVWIYMRKS